MRPDTGGTPPPRTVAPLSRPQPPAGNNPGTRTEDKRLHDKDKQSADKQ